MVWSFRQIRKISRQNCRLVCLVTDPTHACGSSDIWLCLSLICEEKRGMKSVRCALLCCWLDVTNNTMVVANKKSKCLKRNNGWKSLSLLFVTDYHYLFLRNGLKVFYYEVETVNNLWDKPYWACRLDEEKGFVCTLYLHGPTTLVKWHTKDCVVCDRAWNEGPSEGS